MTGRSLILALAIALPFASCGDRGKNEPATGSLPQEPQATAPADRVDKKAIELDESRKESPSTAIGIDADKTPRDYRRFGDRLPESERLDRPAELYERREPRLIPERDLELRRLEGRPTELLPIPRARPSADSGGQAGTQGIRK